MADHYKKKKKTKKEKRVILISVILMIISVVAVLIALFYNGRFFQGENGQVVNDESSFNDVADSLKQEELKKGNKQVNFLLCGLDESEQMTDIIMIVSIDLEKNTANILQVPRDTYIKAGVGSTNKINSAYSSGDKSLSPINRLIKVINDQYKIKIDHYGTVTISSFRKVIDAIGGVPIDMPYQIGNEELGIIPKGYQVLDGEHAEWLVRHRHTYYDQDIGRIKIQRLFLASALKQVRNIGFNEVKSLIPALYGEFTTDLTINEILSYSSLAFNIPMDEIHIYMVPGEGLTYNGQSVWTMHINETADLLNAYFRPYTDAVPAEKLPITELAHTGEFYENTQDDFNSLINGEVPGQKKDDDGNALPTYSHVVTQPKQETTPSVTTNNKETTGTTQKPKVTEVTPDENGNYLDENGFIIHDYDDGFDMFGNDEDSEETAVTYE